MEFVYDLLRQASTCFLLSFLVVTFISFILSLNDHDKTRVLSANILHNPHDDKNQLGIHQAIKIVNETHGHNQKIKLINQEVVFKKVNGIKQDLRERFIKDVDDEQVRKLVDQDKIGGELNIKKEAILDVDGVLSDDEEWEGIETSELEKKFARAMNFGNVGSKDKFGNHLMLHLYGLQKIAMEGPCHDPQPLPINRSARAKWNAWQKLGSMTREDAMEQYISLLSRAIPEWMEEDSTNLMIKWKSSSSRTALDIFPEAN